MTTQTQLTQDQINFIVDTVSKALREALTASAGIQPSTAKKDRTKARIVAALNRSAEYITGYPGYESILKHKAMPKTLLRRALGGNAVNIDDALDELVAEGLISFHPAIRLAGRTMIAYQILENSA
jgi:hypothetical protein